ncbi:MAG TPA: transketolase C-terminal domain-containing protein [Spirochaetia bacterium]|nr:transketolase C-terminal domain-containing protein [Spirochaetia bacterium]
MSEVPQRQAYGQALAEYGEKNQKIVVLDADVSTSTLTSYFATRYPARFFNLGVTEASMVDVGVGMALGGTIPFVNTFAALLTLRACEQIRTCVSYARTNVKLIGGYAGVSDYKDGPTHFATNDIAVMRSLPNITVIAPCDNLEAARMVPLVAELDGPVYMRISRAVVPDVFDSSYAPRIGKGVILREGGDVSLVATGTMVARSILAATQLAERGVRATVLALSTIKPLDTELLAQAARSTGAIVTAEEHTIMGGFGSAAVEALAAVEPVPVEMVGLADNFAETGPDPETLMDAWGLSVGDIVNAALRAIARKAH